AAPLAAAAAEARAALARVRAQAHCGETRFAFVVTGWMPAERVDALRADLAARWGDRLALFASPPPPARWGEVPVVLRNPPALRPFQRLLALVPLPRYGSIDPTAWVAIGFPLLFGFVLGDVAFGLLGLAVAAVALRRRWGGAVGYDVATIALACSASALVFGVLFGEALGELGAHVGLRPLVLDRRHGVMPFLGAAVALGGVHVVAGTALGVVTALRGGHRRHAAGRAARLVLFVAAAAWIAARVGALPAAAATPAIVAGCAGLAGAVAAEGPLALLDLVLGVGNVLSYSRLMALGLASVMLAEVANTVAVRVEPAAAGLVLGVLLHAVNFTLGLVSPTVAALRLHYVEFFEKFYDEGDVPWRPFALA
ncbi:MAG TPA: ATPase, partial [Anaeromyxobacteraceae bacterium]|nr:ATPase [Anaeromyxobacteraceae bacterium]